MELVVGHGHQLRQSINTTPQCMTSVLCQMFTALLISSFSIILASRQFRLSLPIVAQSATGPSVAAHDPGRTVRPRHGVNDSQLVRISLVERQDEFTSGAVATLVVVIVDEYCEQYILRLTLAPRQNYTKTNGTTNICKSRPFDELTNRVARRVHPPGLAQGSQVQQRVVASHRLRNVVAVLELSDLAQVEVLVTLDWLTTKVNHLYNQTRHT